MEEGRVTVDGVSHNAAAACPAAQFATTILLGRPTAAPLPIGAAFVAVARVGPRSVTTAPVLSCSTRLAKRLASGSASACSPSQHSARRPWGPTCRSPTHTAASCCGTVFTHLSTCSNTPSPLAGFRKYTKNGPLYDKTLFTVSGAPDGTPLRIATMTSYDGNVWGTAGPGASTASLATFQRVGTSITTTGGGSRATVTVTISRYRDVWLPTPGQLSKVSFAGPNRTRYTSAFRYNLATDTGVVPLRSAERDSYTVHALVPPAAPDITRVEAFATSDISPDLTAFLQS
jgi:hypothetical protein